MIFVLFSHSVEFDSLWPHGLQHARPPCPLPSPRVCSDSCPLSQWSEVKWSRLVVSDSLRPHGLAPPSMGFSRQGCWSGLPFPSPGDLPDPGIEPRSPALEADALPSEPPGKPWVSDDTDNKSFAYTNTQVAKTSRGFLLRGRELHKCKQQNLSFIRVHWVWTLLHRLFYINIHIYI